MTDGYLFNTALNLDHPGMGPVKAAVLYDNNNNDSNFTTARAAWASHVRSRTNPPKWNSNPSPFEPDDFGPKLRSNPRDYGGASTTWIDYALHNGSPDSPDYDRNRAFKCNHLKGAVSGYLKNSDPEIPRAWVVNSGKWMSMNIHKFPAYTAAERCAGRVAEADKAFPRQYR